MNHLQRIVRLFVPLCLLLALIVWVPAGPALAVPTLRYVDTTGSDASNDCSSILTPCQTVAWAESQSSAGDTIHIAAGTYSEHLFINIDLTLVGAGMDATILDGGGDYTVVAVGAGSTVSLTGLTVQNANYSGGPGGIYNSGTLSLDLVKVTNNTGYNGGGIGNDGPLTVTNSVISYNHAVGGYGGGIFSSDSATVTLSNVTLNGNTTDGYSGGIHMQGGGTLNLTNSTLTGNSGPSSGALTIVSGSSATVLNSTIANNTTSGLNAAVNNYGTISFKNTIVSMNDGTNCFSDGAATWTSLGNNLDSGATCSFGAGGDQSGTNPLLALLGDYGGPVPTRTLLGGSPAIDAGTNTGCPGTDARGFPRPIDGNNDTTATCDIGADEMKQETTTTVITDTPDPSAVGQSVLVSATVTGTLSSPTGSVEITGADSNCTITLAPGGGTTAIGSCSVSYSAQGHRPLVGSYTGDPTHDVSQQAVSHVVALTQNSRSLAANDGWVLESSETSSMGGSLDGTATTLRVGDDALDRQYRGILHFDTSALPDNAVIVSATLKIRRSGVLVGNADPFTTHGVLRADIRKGSFSSNPALQIGDWQAGASLAAAGTFPNTPVSGWYAATLTGTALAKINLTGTTQFRLRFVTGDDDDGLADYWRFFSGDYGTASARPLLIVKYFIP